MGRRNPRGFAEAPQGGTLALDLAGVTGWAYSTAQMNAPHYDHFSVKDEYESHRRKAFDACYAYVSDLCEWYQPQIMVNEKALPVTVYDKDNRGNKKLRVIISNDDTISFLRGMIAAAELACDHADVDTVEYAAATYRSSVLSGMPMVFKKDGGRDWKSVTMRWCNLNGYPVTDDNEADAIVLLEYFNRVHRGFGHVL